MPICIFFYPGSVFWGHVGSLIVMTQPTLLGFWRGVRYLR